MALRERIAALIARQGPISVAEYMTLALHDPQEGYYATRDPLGEAGDFITAPEVSQMFGELIGLWLAQCWQDQGAPAQPLLVELGPGRGTLMADALRALQRAAPAFFEQVSLDLVEASPRLRKRQADVLAPFSKDIRWWRDVHDLPADRPLFLVANEFFDALPVRQYVKTARGWCERMVTAGADGALSFALSPVPASPGVVPDRRVAATLGGLYEVSRAGEAIVEAIARQIIMRGGSALIVDYGYEHSGYGETLQAVRSHSFADVLSDPGLNDLSAHVDFAALREAALAGGAAVFGPVPQGAFLKRLGIGERAQRLGGERVEHQLDRLVADDQMGTLFKALAIVPPAAPAPAGF